MKMIDFKFNVRRRVQDDRATGCRRVLVSIVIAILLATPSIVCATPSQRDVFKSISDNVGESGGNDKAMAFVLAGMALIILLAILSKRRQREVVPTALNHQGKLLKEVLKKVPLKSAEMKQLKLLADQEECSSPLVLLLCPSVLAKAMQHRTNAKIDKQVIAGIARKLGFIKPK